MATIREEIIKCNFLPCSNRTIEYIIIHNTADPGATAENEHTFFSTGGRESSAHYFIDDQEILRIVKDMDIAWAVGDGHGKFGITNANSISIEMCEIEGKEQLIHESTFELVVELMKKYNIPFEKVVRHYDASHKNCPRLLNQDPLHPWDGWLEFKNQLRQKL